jgi:ubiquinone/menaquinone biosynthesis C-methylase UbiE
MPASIIDIAMGISPTARRKLIRFWYQLLARIDTQAHMLYMNYGFADLDSSMPALALDDADAVHRYCIQLYQHAVGSVDLGDRDVLEVGCGRGGGASYIKRYLKPRSLTGVDFSDRAIKFCASYHRAIGAAFLAGDAEALPLEANSFDIVVNVESSHCYNSIERFLGQVYRVLRPGGYFLYADFREHDAIDTLRRQLGEAGFTICMERDITPNVVRALDLDSDRKLALIGQHIPRIIRKRFLLFAATPGTSMYEGFRSGQILYRSFVAQKL